MDREQGCLRESYNCPGLSPESIYPKKHSPVVENLTAVLSEDDLEKYIQQDERAKYILKRENGIQTIITRNIKDYNVKDIAVLTAEELLKTISP